MNTQHQASSSPDLSLSRGKRVGVARLGRVVLAGTSLLCLSLPPTALQGAVEGVSEFVPEPPPAFVFEPLFATNQGTVHGIYAATHADLVLVRGGFDSGFRTGMVCRVEDAEEKIGEVMLVDVRNNCAAAIIMELEAGQVIEPGHSVSVKTVKF